MIKNSKKSLQGLVVFKKFTVGKKLGTGAFGEIYLVINNQDDSETYALKAEPENTRHPQLKFQAKLYKYLNSEGEVQGIPKVYTMGMEGGFNLMMMDLLGKSLEDLFVERNKKFSVKTVLMIGQQLIDRIKFMHSRHFLHRDVKPDNLLMGTGCKQNVLFLVDMGLAKKFTKQGKHIPYKEGKQLTGTARYASISTHQGIQQARRDDIESIGYVLMYFLRGILPWQNMKAKDTHQKYSMIMNKKISTPLDQLCKGYPQELNMFIAYARALKFEQAPDYQYLKQLLAQAWKKGGYEKDYHYDWFQKSV